MNNNAFIPEQLKYLIKQIEDKNNSLGTRNSYYAQLKEIKFIVDSTCILHENSMSMNYSKRKNDNQ
jgi:hypothetical protein